MWSHGDSIEDWKGSKATDCACHFEYGLAVYEDSCRVDFRSAFRRHFDRSVVVGFA